MIKITSTLSLSLNKFQILIPKTAFLLYKLCTKKLLLISYLLIHGDLFYFYVVGIPFHISRTHARRSKIQTCRNSVGPTVHPVYMYILVCLLV